jgi:hypothetical protein
MTNNSQVSPTHRAMKKRPASLTILMWMVYLLIFWNAIRVGATIANWGLLENFASPPDPAYIAGSASFWILCGLGTLILIRRRNPRAHLAAAGFAIIYAIWWWVDMLLLQGQVEANWPFSLTLTGILLILTAYLAFNRNTTAYLGQRDSTEQTQTTSDKT